MEEMSTPSLKDARWSEEFVRTLAAQRERALEFSGNHRRQIGELESELAGRFSQVSDELDRTRRALADEQAALTASRAQLEAAQAKLKLDERNFAEQRRNHEADVEELAHQRQRVQEKLADLDRQLEAAEDEKSRAKLQRRRIAQELKEQRDKAKQEFAQERLDIERAQNQLGEAGALAAELAEFRQRCASLEEQLAPLEALRAHCGELERQAAELGERCGALEQETAELGELRQRCAELERQLAERPAEDGAGPQLAELAAERDRLASRLADSEARLAEAERQAPGGESDGKLAEELADMQRRYQLAMDDVREMKRKNGELEKRLAAGAAAPAAPSGGGDAMDWEAQKRRLLAALEANEDGAEDESEEDRAERIKIRDVVAKTDAVLAAKEQEIEELKQLLDAQSNNIGEMAVGAQAIAEMLNQDEVIAAERERLMQLQKEWEEKLRQAEIDLSVQRAKLARERAEIEERQRVLQQQQGEQVQGGSPADGSKSKKPPRGRWLTRLGLKEQDEE